MLLSEQIRAARMLLDWNQEVLSQRSGVGLSTLKRLESRLGPLAGNAETVWKLQEALEAAGIRFIDANDDGGPGVRLVSAYKSGR